MKLWEVIKELDENPNKKFISTVDSSRPEEKRKLARVGDVIKMTNDSTFWLTDEWEEVVYPVTFIEAIESGKKIRFKHHRFNIANYVSVGDIIEKMHVFFTNEDIKEVILNGEWFIQK